MIARSWRVGSFGWLVMHEVRLEWRARARGMSGLIGGSLLLVYVLVGFLVAANLVHWTIAWSPAAGAIALLSTIALFTLMTAQAMLACQRTLYEVGDLDLLLTSPMPERRVLSAKLTGIAAGIVLTYAVLLLPMIVPFALLGHPGQFGIVGLLFAASLAAAAVGLALTLLLARTIGPRAARTVGQILAALLGGGFYLVSQLSRVFEDNAAGAGLYGWASAHHLGVEGPTGLPGLAAFGNIGAIAVILLPAMLSFVAVGGLLHAVFLTGYQDGGMRSHRARAAGRQPTRAFAATLGSAVFAKEWRLLARDPALAFQIVLRLVYLVPLLLIGFRHGDGPGVAPTLAFASVLIASQLTGSLAWLTISAEDAPDLLVTAPVAAAAIGRAKLYAALAMAAPLAIVTPLAMLAWSPAGAVVTLVATSLSGVACGQIELRLGKAASRTAFAKRGKGSFGATMLGLFVACVGGGAAGTLTWLIG